MSPNINVDINFLKLSPVSSTQPKHNHGAVKGKNCCHETLTDKPRIKFCCRGCEEPMGETLFAET